jgi:hypothetical protein
VILEEHDMNILAAFVDYHTRPGVQEGLFDKQLEVFQSQRRRKLALCGRRSGKTTTLGRLAVEGAEKNPKHGEDESLVCYMAPSKNQAKRLMWGRLQTLAAKQKTEIKFIHTELIARHANGCEIWIMGADDDRDVDRLRGFPFRRVIIDEAQGVPIDLKELITDILDPALADFGGDLILAGTPHPACIGYFFEASTGKVPGWEVHHWTITDNPAFPLWRGKPDWQRLAKEFLTNKLKDNQWTDEHPTFQREWLGQWVKDEGGLVYKYRAERDSFDNLPGGMDWRHVVGVDLGQSDAFAAVTWAFSEDSPVCYCVDQYRQPGLTVSDWAAVIRDLQQRFKPVSIVADAGGLGKAIIEELSTRHQLPVKPAEKVSKFDFIELFNGDLIAGLTKIKSGSAYARELELIQYDEKHRREDPRFPNDTADAGLYGWRECRHWMHRPKVTIPEVGTDGHAAWVADRMRDQRTKDLKARQRKKFVSR